MGLVLKENIRLKTPLGVSEVQLMFGDITQLSVEEKVDIVFISAFPGDYSPIHGTLIHALKTRLGLVVREVAKTKELDLRRNFHCWVSKVLPDHLPYRRLVCFERLDRKESLRAQISGMFRAMMPVFNNQETTIITPLLASGGQLHSESSALESLVSAACHWIKAGLPLKCLKVVVYSENPHAILRSERLVLYDIFSQLKVKWEEIDIKQLSKVEKKFDVCISFAEGDEDLVSEIVNDLQKAYIKIVVHQEQFMYDHDQVWQEQIFDVMVQSQKIIAVITPRYMAKSECLEQFNLALCCNRLTGSDVLAPFYIETVDVYPSYMSHIQYTDCRAIEERESASEKILAACVILVNEIHIDGSAPVSDKSCSGNSSTIGAVLPVESSMLSTGYDVFISYAHRTPNEANRMYENLLDVEPNLKVFLDKSELRTGSSWQETLYEAVGKTRMFLAFISQSFVQSSVCQEEYNIGLARYMSQDGIFFLPLLVDSALKELPVMFSAGPLVDISNPSMFREECYYEMVELLVHWLKGQKEGKLVVNKFCRSSASKKVISHVTMNWRRRYFQQRFCFKSNGHVQLKQTFIATSEGEPEFSQRIVVLSFAKDCSHQALLLSRILGEQTQNNITCEFLTLPQSGEKQAPRLRLLDSADMVVVIVSDAYMASSQHRHELHIILCRQRICKDRQVVYLIEAHHTRAHPLYAHLLHLSINLGDGLWTQMFINQQHDEDNNMIIPPNAEAIRVICSVSEKTAISAAALDIVSKLSSGGQNGDSGMPTNIVNLVNLLEVDQNVFPTSENLVPFSLFMGDKTSISVLPSSSPHGDNIETQLLSGSKGNKEAPKDVAKSVSGHVTKRSCGCHII